MDVNERIDNMQEEMKGFEGILQNLLCHIEDHCETKKLTDNWKRQMNASRINKMIGGEKEETEEEAQREADDEEAIEVAQYLALIDSKPPSCSKCELYGECDHQGAYQKDGKWCYEPKVNIKICLKCHIFDTRSCPWYGSHINYMNFCSAYMGDK